MNEWVLEDDRPPSFADGRLTSLLHETKNHGKGVLLAGLGICSLLALSYLPAKLLHISSNPLYRFSGVASQSRVGLTGGLPVIDPNEGTTTQALGHLSAEDWLHGQVPWWNPYAGVGLPLAAEMQSESFFLPFVLILHFSGGVIYLRIIMQALAGIFTFLLLRQLRLSPPAAFLGAIFYSFNGTFAWFGHGEIMPLAFLPLLLLGIERAVECEKTHRFRGGVVIAVAIAYSIYSGFPETAFIDGLLALLWALTRLITISGSSRRLFVARVCVGGVSGLLLAAPLAVPFFEYLQHSGVAHNNFTNAGIPKSSFLQLLLPYAYGPIEGLISADRANELIIDWGNIGGYFGIAVTFLAVLGTVAERRERALRALLALWTVILVARTINAPGTNALFGLIPGMNLVAVFRNSSGSFEMATAILAALAIDRWVQGGIPRWKALVSAGVASMLTLMGLAFGSAMAGRLESTWHRNGLWLWSSLACAVLFLGAPTALCLFLPTRPRMILLGATVTAECLSLYMVPQFAGLRDITMDVAPLNYLKDHLGWQRAYALGGIHPNYGSYFQVPFIDHESLPVSDSWIRYIRANLDPDIDAVTFSGDVPEIAQDRARALRSNLTSFEQTGVLFVTVPRNSNPFEEWTVLPHEPGGNIPAYLDQGQQITGTLPPVPISVRVVHAAMVLIGTDGGAATGVLRMQLCSGQSCVESSEELANATDNAPFPLEFEKPLSIDPATRLRYTLRHIDSKHKVAIWMYPAGRDGATATLPDGAKAERTPDIRFTSSEHSELKRVFRSATEDVFRLPNAAPYFGAAKDACKLTVISHQFLRASCPAAGTLIRRELFYPGWQAFVNGRAVEVRADSIFQSINLPAGDSTVEFRYLPSHIGLACIGALLGLTILLAGCYWPE